MLTISAISKSFSGRVLFQDASLQVNRGDRIGLVGANGAGKSTLFSIILGEDSPDEGRISMERGITFGFLPQESAAVGGETVIDLATGVTPELVKARETMRRCEREGHTETDEYHEAVGDFAENDGHSITAKAKRILSGLAFREKDVDRPAAALSGGWVMRAHLARLLTQEPDLLLLDEPTNHLDLESLVWFREYLRGYPGAILMISHDRDFLNQLVRDVVEIARCKIHRYRGNFDAYLAEKAARDVQHAAAYANQQREIERLQDFVDRFRAKASKATQAQSKLKQIERMDLIEAPPDADAKVKFRFPQPQRSGHRVITLKDVDFAYKGADGAAELTVYRGLNFEAERSQRTVLVGPNGAGKSTLIKLLAGLLEPQRGERTLGHNVRTGYFAQNRVEQLNMRQTVLEAAQDLPSRPGEQISRTVLGSFLFRGDDVFKPVAVLSGGEKSRLALARLLLDPPNLILMDEPTTHLDIPSIDALIGALEQYEGTVIFISHDVHFIRRVASTVLHISAGQLTPYAGDYQYYLDKTRATSAKEALVAGEQLHDFQPAAAAEVKQRGPGLKEIKERERAAANERKAAAQAKRDREKRVAELEQSIATMEGRQRDLTQLLQNPLVHAPGGTAPDLSRELTELTRKLYETNSEWERELALLEQA